MRRLWQGLAIAIAFAAITAGGVVITQEGGDAEAANLHVFTTGQDCTYQSTAVTYEVAQANGWVCGTFDEAYDEIRTATGASCGGLVIIKAGTYPEQTLTGYRSNCPVDAPTVFRPENFDCDLEEYPTTDTPVLVSGTVSPGDAQNEGASAAVGHVTLCGLTLLPCNCNNTNASGSATDNSRYAPFVRGSRYLTYQRSRIGGFSVFLTGFDELNTGAGHISFLYNDISECHEYSNVCGNGKLDIVENALIEGNFFNNFRSLSNCTTGGAVDCGHHETMFINGTKDVTIRRNRFFNYEQSGAVYTTCSGPDVTGIVGYCHLNLLIENNWFESPSNTNQGGQDPGDGGERGEAVVGPGHCEGKTGTDLDNVVIRFNTAVGQNGEFLLSSGGGGCVIGTGDVRIYGNIANRITSTDGCSVTNLFMDYNIGTIYGSNGSNPCGANEHNGTAGTSIMVNPTWGSVSQDMHLLSDSTVAAAFVPVSEGCPTEDYDGDTRPSVGSCDAGADER